MIKLTPHVQTLLCSLVASQGAVVGGKNGAEKELHQLLNEASQFEATDEQPTMKNVPQKLLQLAKVELEEGIPSEEQIKNWFIYELDLSGITFYETNDNKLVFASLVRSIDLSSGSQYFDNRREAFAYSEARRYGDEERLRVAEDALKAKLPNKKLRYLHWIGNKPTEAQIIAFKASHPDYF